MQFPSRNWIDHGWQDFAAADMNRVIAVLPVAAVEQHGPHLPVGVDTHIMQGYLERAIPLVPADLDVLFLPIQAIGKSNEHLAFPGTLTLSAETVIRAWTEIGESVARAGCRKLVIVNSHGGNIAPIDIVARELRVRHGMLAVHVSWHRFGYPEGDYSASELYHGIHAGEVETSLMLAFRPDTVRMEKAQDFRTLTHDLERRSALLRHAQPAGFGWMSQDISEPGAMGNAAAATADKGMRAADFGAERFIALLREVQDFDLANLKSGPLGPTS
jgi:creatinine amidohydrolase